MLRHFLIKFEQFGYTQAFSHCLYIKAIGLHDCPIVVLVRFA